VRRLEILGNYENVPVLISIRKIQLFKAVFYVLPTLLTPEPFRKQAYSVKFYKKKKTSSEWRILK
jgi:hypothetical protein